MKATFLFSLLILVLAISCPAQISTDNKNNKSPGKKELKKEAVIETEEELKKFEEEWRQDSIRMLEKWKKEWVEDSTRLMRDAEKAMSAIHKLYKEKWNPADSLVYIDKKAETIFNNKNESSLSEIIVAINKNFTKPLHKARAIYYWIANNIRYDWDAYKNGSSKYFNDTKENALQTFRNRKGVCDNYSSLYEYMASECGLEVVKIIGYAKVWPFTQVNKSRTDHAWNAVKINGQWKLIDVTWAANEDSTMDYFWFDTPPDKFIYSHYPADSAYQWQKRKISLNDFALLPIINQYYFASGAPAVISPYGYYTSTNGVFQLEMKKTANKYRVKLECTKVTTANNKSFNGDESWQELPVSVKTDSATGTAFCTALLPTKGHWWIKVSFLEKVNLKFLEEIEYPGCMIFQLTF